MAKITIPYLRLKNTAGGPRYYWQPSDELKKAGWQALRLGQDEQAAICAARARNDEIAVWRKGGTAPGDVARIVQRRTVDYVIAEYKKHRFDKLKDSTASEYASKLKMISKWAGSEQMDAITRKNITDFRDALYAPRKDGTVRENTAYNTLKMVRTLWEWACLNGHIPSNPAKGDLDISTPDPRQQFASALGREALVAAAIELGRPNMAAAMIIAWTIGQREGDLIKMLQTRFAEIQPYEADDPAVYGRLAAREHDGRVMGIRLKQGKTDRWIGVPVVGDARVQLEAAIAAARAKGLTTILFDEERDRTWTSSSLSEKRTRQAHFQRSFGAIRDQAVATLTATGDDELAAEVKDLQFRDFRRTCVVTMGQRGIPDHLIAAITGHRLETVKKILEVYLPRTTGMAMLAVDLTNERAPRQIAREVTKL